MRACIVLLFFFLSFAVSGEAQDSVYYNNKKWSGSKAKSRSDFNSTAKDLQQSLEQNNDTRAAQQYVQLAKQFEQTGDLAKAEQYLKRALDIYSKQRNNVEVANITRDIAKLQESQNKIQPAITNYRNAAANSSDKTLERANYNDANRLANSDNPQVQEDYAKKNVDLFDTLRSGEDKADAYMQLAETQLKQNNPEAAITTIQKAIAVSPKGSETSDQLSRQLVNLYANTDQKDSAVIITTNLIEKAKQANDATAQIEHMILLADLYIKSKQSDEAIATLRQAYVLALKSNNAMLAKAITERLAAQYQSQGNKDLSINTYRNFLQDMDSLIRKDSSLLDRKLFALTEGRIHELEQERALQVELIKRKTTFNYFLIASLAAMLLAVLLIVRSLRIIKQRNKKIALQSLRREMNPHFIFNSLNSVNQYIAENNELEANKYLSSYSGLMRNIMEHSNKDFVTVNTELEQLQKYLELEHRRFKDKFDFNIAVDEAIDKDLCLMPNMLLQPHLENAIWHGLRYKETKGMLSLQFVKEEDKIRIVIMDNGIGLAQSAALKTSNQKAHQSRGLANTRERVQLLNDIYRLKITMELQETDKANGTGTIVTIQIPILHKFPL